MKPKKAGNYNRITCKCVKGIYKDQDMEIELGPTSHETSVKVNGKRVELVQSIHIGVKVGGFTTVTIEKFKTPGGKNDGTK